MEPISSEILELVQMVIGSQGSFSIQGGVAGGWTLVIVYENVNLPGKKIYNI